MSDNRRKEIEAQMKALQEELDAIPKWDGAKVGDRVRVVYEFELRKIDSTDSCSPWWSMATFDWYRDNADMVSFEVIERA